jgi:hypothetical protein
MNTIKFLLLILASSSAFSLEYGECKGTQKARKLAVEELGVFAKKFIEQQGTLAQLARQYEQGQYNGVPAKLAAYYIFVEPEVGRIYSWCQLKNRNPEKYSEIVESCGYEISSGAVTCKVLRYEFLPDKK